MKSLPFLPGMSYKLISTMLYIRSYSIQAKIAHAYKFQYCRCQYENHHHQYNHFCHHKQKLIFILSTNMIIIVITITVNVVTIIIIISNIIIAYLMFDVVIMIVIIFCLVKKIGSKYIKGYGNYQLSLILSCKRN